MPSEPLPLIVFARAPRPGRTKTRLIPALGADGAARLSAAFLEDVLATATEVPGLAPELWCPSAEDAARFTRARVQEGDDLGARMQHALADALRRAPAALLIGSDVPTLPARWLRDALAGLARAEVVVGPSSDGGYWLVGARGEAPDLSGAIRWSTRHALADTRAALGARRVVTTRPWYDVDTPEDLRLLRLHLATRPAAAPRSARVLCDFDPFEGA